MKFYNPFVISSLQHKYRSAQVEKKRSRGYTRLEPAAKYRTISQRGKSWLGYIAKPVKSADIEAVLRHWQQNAPHRN